MNEFDCAMKVKEETTAYNETVTAASANVEMNNLFAILAEAEQAHHDALVEMKGEIGPQTSQLKVLHGKACLFKTSPGKA